MPSNTQMIQINPIKSSQIYSRNKWKQKNSRMKTMLQQKRYQVENKISKYHVTIGKDNTNIKSIHRIA